jgi:hypothetical protein
MTRYEAGDGLTYLGGFAASGFKPAWAHHGHYHKIGILPQNN